MSGIGFSAGDVALALKFVVQVSRSFRESGGASSEYQEVLRYLEGLLLTLQQLQKLDAKATDPTVIKAIEALSSSCASPLNEFIEGIRRFEASLGVAAGGGRLKAGFKKAQWSLFVSEKVEKLKGRIDSQLQPIHLLLESQTLVDISKNSTQLWRIHQQIEQQATQLEEQACLNAQLVNAVQRLSLAVSRETDQQPTLYGLDAATLLIDGSGPALIPDSLHEHTSTSDICRPNSYEGHPLSRSLHVILLELVTFLCELFRCCQDLFRYVIALSPQCFLLLQVFGKLLPRSPSLLLEDNIYFEDVLGRPHSLQYAYFRHWKVFVSLLEESFRNRPGEKDVQHRRYLILDCLQENKHISEGDWGNAIVPGKRIAMSVIRDDFQVQGKSCPMPSCTGQLTPSNFGPAQKCSTCMIALFAHDEPLSQGHSSSIDSGASNDSQGSSSTGSDGRQSSGEIWLGEKDPEAAQINPTAILQYDRPEASYFKRIHVKTGDLASMVFPSTDMNDESIGEEWYHCYRIIPLHIAARALTGEPIDSTDSYTLAAFRRVKVHPVSVDQNRLLRALDGLQSTSFQYNLPKRHSYASVIADALTDHDLDPRFEHNPVHLNFVTNKLDELLSGNSRLPRLQGSVIAIFSRRIAPGNMIEFEMNWTRNYHKEPRTHLNWAKTVRDTWEKEWATSTLSGIYKSAAMSSFDHQLFSGATVLRR